MDRREQTRNAQLRPDHLSNVAQNLWNTYCYYQNNNLSTTQKQKIYLGFVETEFPDFLWWSIDFKCSSRASHKPFGTFRESKTWIRCKYWSRHKNSHYLVTRHTEYDTNTWEITWFLVMNTFILQRGTRNILCQLPANVLHGMQFTITCQRM